MSIDATKYVRCWRSSARPRPPNPSESIKASACTKGMDKRSVRGDWWVTS